MEASRFLVVFSGAARPVVAIVTALIVYVALDQQIVSLELRNTPGGDKRPLYLITSFLAGFSERFADDVLARVPGGARTGNDPPSSG